MKFLLTRKVITKKYIISELYVDDEFVSLVTENIENGNINNVLSKGEYKISQFFSVKMQQKVYAIEYRDTISNKSSFYILQRGGDINVVNRLKFRYIFSQKKYLLNIK